MIENEYPMPSWVSGTFDVPEDWLQVPVPKDGAEAQVLALDCEMTCKKVLLQFCPLTRLQSITKIRKRVDKSLYH